MGYQALHDKTNKVHREYKVDQTYQYLKEYILDEGTLLVGIQRAFLFSFLH